MKLLLLGSGGREHALAWKIAQSPKIEKLYIAPGNAGTSNVGENVAIKADDFTAIREFVVKNNIDMVVVGPEDPLVKGIYDYFKKDEALKNIPVIGPSKAGAVLEGSKEFAKGFMQRHNIPTAGYKSITAANLDKDGKLPATFMVVAPGSWNQLEVWDDINRMRTLNTTQSRRRAQMHVCPLQLDIVERIINRYSNEGDTVYDPFGGLMTVPMTAIKMHRNGKGCELNPDYFRDGVGYLQAAENEVDEPTLFDFMPEVLP